MYFAREIIGVLNEYLFGHQKEKNTGKSQMKGK
jgi:hypothetical protein